MMCFRIGVCQVDFSKTTVGPIHKFGRVTVFEKIRPMRWNGKTIQWRGRFCASIGSDGILLVDNGFEPIADTMIHAIKKLNQGPIRFLINTHWHQDHTGANHILGKGATIISHEWTRREMMVEKKYPDGTVIPAAPKEALPNITFQNSMSVYFNGEEVNLIPLPEGHTEGDIVVFFTKSKVICMGDAFNGHFFPNIYGDVEAYAKNFERLIQMLPEDVKVVSGHREMATLEDLKEYHRMLIETTEIVQKRMEDGRSLAEIKAEGLPSEWDSWSDPNAFNALTTKQWIEAVSQSLYKNKMSWRFP